MQGFKVCKSHDISVHMQSTYVQCWARSQVKHFDGCSMEQLPYQHVGQHVLASVCRRSILILCVDALTVSVCRSVCVGASDCPSVGMQCVDLSECQFVDLEHQVSKCQSVCSLTECSSVSLGECVGVLVSGWSMQSVRGSVCQCVSLLVSQFGGVLVCWRSVGGSLVCRSVGRSVGQSVGLLVYRSACWSVSLGERWFVKVLVCLVGGLVSQLVGLGVSLCQYVAHQRVSMQSVRGSFIQYDGVLACQFGGASASVCQSIGLWSFGGPVCPSVHLSVCLWSLLEGQYVVYQ